MPLEVPREGFAPLIERALGAMGGAAGEGAREALAAYLTEVVAWNRKIDLTAARSPDELVDLFVADAAVIARATAPESGAWVDVGSGAGAPGLVLAVLMPERPMTLVEPRERRVAFLRSAIGKLRLPHVVVERKRSDALPEASFATAVARATLPPPEWLREGARLARRRVWVLLARDEPPALPGFHADVDERYEWPLTGAKRRALRYVRSQAGGDAEIDGRAIPCEK